MLKRLLTLSFGVVTMLMLQGCITTAVVGTAAVATKVATDPRSAGRQLDDETLEERVSYALGKDAQLQQDARINVVAYNGKVLLIGQAPDEASLEMAKNLAVGVDGVNEVYNEIRVSNKIGAMQIAKDSWITTQAKSKLLVSAEVKATDVKVITENGEVFVLGKLTESQGNAATESIRTISGVQKVITVFSYPQ